MEAPTTPTEASRFLHQASFGATAAEIARLQRIGYGPWLDEQFAMPERPAHLFALQAAAASGAKLTDAHLMNSFWAQAVTGPDALRQRVAFALSQIFVVSLQDVTVAKYRRGVGSYLDMLGREAFGTYRSLLEAVTRHPMMGLYLSHLRNQKEDPARSREPDQNYAREVMQLFSIGLHELHPDGTPRVAGGQPVESYDSDDVIGLSRVFTGFSWAGPDLLEGRFLGRSTPAPDPNRDVLPMQGYPQFHSTAEKRFLGTVIPAGEGRPDESLRIVLDTLAAHPNVGPFLGRQLIQRLVTSNPSAAYVWRVGQAFDSGRFRAWTWATGSGRRGDLRATIAAVLLDQEARSSRAASGPGFGRVREPILRLANWMRAFNARSASGRFLLGATDDPATSLGQSPMRAPSVFNFQRPGYVPPNTAIAAAGLVAPELQNVHETSVVGYANFMRSAVSSGVGSGSPRDIQADYAAELSLADRPEALVDRVSLLLCAGSMSSGTRALIRDAVASVPLTARNEATARPRRVWVAVLCTLSSSDYLVQK